MKYKLIKEYPGSPGLGTIYEPLLFNSYKNYTEFWEEVIEKDYEILSIKSPYGPLLIDKLTNGEDFAEIFLSPKRINEGYKIHSVKRLSDSEVFTLKEIIDIRVDNKYKEEILEINIVNNQIRFKTKKGFVVLEVAKKVKQPLFTTEDGVDIFEGDSFIRVDIKTMQLFDEKVTHNVHKNYIGVDFFKERGILHFSTKEKAEEYILLNKPCLSFMDINPILTNYTQQIALKEIIKSKL